jgi:acyl carrier protein
MQILQDVIDILAEVLSLGPQKGLLNADTALLGSLPDLDSFAVVQIITRLEEHFNIVFEDDEMTARTFENIGTLTALVSDKLAA